MVRRILFFIAFSIACNTIGFDPQTLVGSVRVIISRADKPYAKPGEVVKLEVLAADERPLKPSPMKIYWIPFTCTNPRDDLYYACFSSLVPSAGPPSQGPALPPFLRPGFDVTALLPQGNTFEITIPPDIISSHKFVAGIDEQYGLAIVFFIACAGRVRIAEIDPSSPNPQIRPIQCTDDDGKELSPDDWVFSFTRVYAYANETNNNPVIESLTVDGAVVSPRDGITVPPCTDLKTCKKPKLDVVVPMSSWEERPASKVDPMRERHELVYATYYYTRPVGSLDKDGRILYDANKGKVVSGMGPGGDVAAQITPPDKTGDGRIWVIVQDNRNGASFVELPVHVR